MALAAAAAAQSRGIGISAFGIGEDWNDVFLDSLAARGGGMSDYIDEPTKVQRVLKAQIRGLSNIVLRRVSAQITVAPFARLVSVCRVLPHMEILPIGPDGGVSIGDLLLGETTSLALEFTVRQTHTGTRRIARMVIEGTSVLSSETIRVWQDIRATFTRSLGDRPVPPRLLNALERLSVFRLQERAWRALESGDVSQASGLLRSTATRLIEMGYPELGHAASSEAERVASHGQTSIRGRKQLRYGTRALVNPNI
jgi:Ca-activated chloride channel family protein